MKQLLSAFLLAGALRAEFASQHWNFRRQVATTRALYNVVALDSSIYQSSSSRLNDLRLLRDGQEVPYLIRTLSSAKEEKLFAPALSNRVAVAGLGVRATLDVGRHSPHNRVIIDTGETNFKLQVRVETSEDGRQWGTARRDGTIFDVSTADQHVSNLSVSYPESTQRFLRITVVGWTNPAALRRAAVGFVRKSAAERDIVSDAKPSVSVDPNSRESVVDCDLGFDRPFDRLTFEIPAGLFSREVTVSVSRNKKEWSTAGFGTIGRIAREERLTIEMPEQWDRYVRAVVRNDDNPPLTFTKLRLEALRRQMVFPTDQQGSYQLYSGNSTATPVRYDLVAILPEQATAALATLGPLEKNPDYRPPSPPVTERSPWLLSTLLLILVPVIGFTAIRMLRQVRVGG